MCMAYFLKIRLSSTPILVTAINPDLSFMSPRRCYPKSVAIDMMFISFEIRIYLVLKSSFFLVVLCLLLVDLPDSEPELGSL